VGHKIFTYMFMRGGQVRPCQTRQRFAYPLQLPSVNFQPCLYILVVSFRCLLTSRCSRQFWSWTANFTLSLLGHWRASKANKFIRTVAFCLIWTTLLTPQNYPYQVCSKRKWIKFKDVIVFGGTQTRLMFEINLRANYNLPTCNLTEI